MNKIPVVIPVVILMIIDVNINNEFLESKILRTHCDVLY